jgi:3-deoxy-D-manno-octulosonic-acid transferase
MRYLYSAVLYILLPFVLLRMLLRSRRAPDYRRRLAERFGLFDLSLERSRPVIWLHAVSLGEVLAAARLIDDLLLLYPRHQLVVTTTTPTGSERVQALFGDRVCHVYAPWDLPGSVRRFLRRTRPQLLLVMETELWPNMLHYSAACGCKVMLANARLSQRSAAGYARFGALSRPMLQRLDVVACQGRADGRRFLSLGLPAAALQVTGSIKFDLELDGPMRASALQLREDFAADSRPILVAASTHPGEDEMILQAFAQVRERVDNCLLVLVPRHPERFGDVHTLCAKEGWQVRRRSAGDAPGAADDVLLGDTVGELLLLLSVASVALIGGSLVDRGGHNMLEAAVWGVPVVTGPSLYNFAEIGELLTSAGAMVRLDNSAQLGDTLLELLSSPERRRAMGAAGQQVVADNRGARKRLLHLVERQLAVEA